MPRPQPLVLLEGSKIFGRKQGSVGYFLMEFGDPHPFPPSLSRCCENETIMSLHDDLPRSQIGRAADPGGYLKPCIQNINFLSEVTYLRQFCHNRRKPIHNPSRCNFVSSRWPPSFMQKQIGTKIQTNSIHLENQALQFGDPSLVSQKAMQGGWRGFVCLLFYSSCVQGGFIV